MEAKNELIEKRKKKSSRASNQGYSTYLASIHNLIILSFLIPHLKLLTKIQNSGLHFNHIPFLPGFK